MKEGTSSLGSGIWVTASRVMAQLIQFAIFIVAARVLQPAEFGVFALVAAVIVFLNQIAIAGWSEYILNWQGTVERLRYALWVAGLAGVILAVTGMLIAVPIAQIFDQPDAEPLARILSLSVFFSAVASAYAGVLVWQNKLVASAFCSLLGEAVNLAVAIPALLYGQGIMALAFGRLAGAIAFCLSAIAIARITPAMAPQRVIYHEIGLYSGNITLTRLLVTLRAYGATLIIGSLMGPAAVGYYRAAQRVIGAFEEIVSEPVRVLAWSFFRKVPQSTSPQDAFGRAADRFFPILIYASVPLFIGIVVMASDLVHGILGPEWGAAVPIVQILAVAALVRAPGTTSVPILSLVGKIKLMPRYMFLYACLTLVCIAAGAAMGLVSTAVAEVVAALAVFAISARVMNRHAGLQWNRILRASWPVLPALAIALSLPLLANHYDLLVQIHPLLRFLGLGIAMIVVYIPVLSLCDRTLWSRLSGKVPK
jgi:O-antigen/teichoic acid export membrane protein